MQSWVVITLRARLEAVMAAARGPGHPQTFVGMPLQVVNVCMKQRRVS